MYTTLTYNRRNDLARTPLMHCAAIVSCLLAATAIAQQPIKPEEDKDEKVGERLVRQAGGHADDDIMEELMRMMHSVRRRLDEDFDPGEKTQQLQKEIMERLDNAIAEAAARRSTGKQVRSRAQGERRRMQEPTAGKDKSGDVDESASAGEGNTQPGKGSVQAGDQPEQSRTFDARRAWGHLPARERDEVIQGRDEEFLEAYREWIERYYRALQESDEN